MKIQTEQEYNAALQRVHELLDVALGTPESAELEELVTAIERYEAAHYPMGKGAAYGILKDVKPDPESSEEESPDSSIE